MVILCDDRGQRVEVMDLRDHAASRGDIRRVQRREPGVTPEDAEHPDALVRAGVVRWRLMASFARVIAVEKPMQYSVLDIVVHGLGNGHERDAGVEALGVGQRVVADRDQDVDAERLEVLEDHGRHVEDPPRPPSTANANGR